MDVSSVATGISSKHTQMQTIARQMWREKLEKVTEWPTYLEARVALLFSWERSKFHHWPRPRTLPAFLRMRPRTALGRRETRGVTNQMLGLCTSGVWQGETEIMNTKPLPPSNTASLAHPNYHSLSWEILLEANNNYVWVGQNHLDQTDLSSTSLVQLGPICSNWINYNFAYFHKQVLSFEIC